MSKYFGHDRASSLGCAPRGHRWQKDEVARKTTSHVARGAFGPCGWCV